MSLNENKKRSSNLIAEFIDGFAVGWQFAIPDGFKDALDIKLTSKVENKSSQKKWTQGKGFEFKTGDLLFNHISAYNNFHQFLKGKNSIALQVVSSSASSYDATISNNLNKQKSISVITNELKENIDFKDSSDQFKGLDGLLVVEFRPNQSKDRLEEVRKFSLSQEQFVTLLRTGMHIGGEQSSFLDFRFNLD